MKIGENIKKFRREKGMTQEKLGEVLFVSQQQISQYESGEKVPRVDTVQKIADALGIPICELINEPQDMAVQHIDKWERKGFSLNVVGTDQFLNMPATSQNLYFHLGMRADNNGFISSPKRIVTMTGVSQGDLKLLVDRGYVTALDGGGICIIQ